jgi:hypothetical protein
MILYLIPASMLVAFLVSLTIFSHRNSNTEQYLRLFPWFLLLSGIVEVIENYQGIHHRNNLLLANPFTVLTFCFYFYTLYCIIHNKLARKIIFLLIWLYPLVALVNIYFIQKAGVFHTVTYCLGCLLVVVICFYYFLELFRLPKSVNLIRQPAFWICSGLLFYFCCTFPMYGFNAIVAGNVTPAMMKTLIILLTILNVFLYSSFTIAFLCRLRTRKSM